MGQEHVGAGRHVLADADQQLQHAAVALREPDQPVVVDGLQDALAARTERDVLPRAV